MDFSAGGLGSLHVLPNPEQGEHFPASQEEPKPWRPE